MTAFRVGDIPASPTIFEIVDDIPTTGYTSAIGVLTAPDGTSVALTGATFTIGSDTDDEGDAEGNITVSWGSTVSRFLMPGLYDLAVTLKGSGSLQQTLPSFPIIVEKEDGWLTISSLRRNWRDAPLDDEDCFELLYLSKDAVVAFAPPLVADPDTGIVPTPPANYRKGQRMQARNTWNAAKVDAANGSFGSDTFVIRPVPLDWAVKQVLRPKTAIPVVP